MERQTRVAPAGWPMVAAGAALVGCCYGLARFGYGLLAPRMQAELGFTASLSGLISAGSYVGYCVAILVSLVLTRLLGPRRVAIIAGVVATVGTGVVALAPTAGVLALGVLVAGSSTGLASPPLAAAVAQWTVEPARDRAQTVVNAGTGLGVVVSGPVALVVSDDWRVAWGTFAVISAVVTAWVGRAVPSGRTDDASTSVPPWSGAAARISAAAFLMGVSSTAVWTFGQDLLAAQDDLPRWAPGVGWILLGAAGIAGAFGGDLVRRFGLGPCWALGLLAMTATTVVLGLVPDVAPVVLLALAIFGASYIALTGVVLVWGTRLYPHTPSAGVTLGFLLIAVGQAAGGPLAGAVADAGTLTTAFLVVAVAGVAGACLGPRAEAASTDPG